jgi:hypothetical protein
MEEGSEEASSLHTVHFFTPSGDLPAFDRLAQVAPPKA